MSRMRIAAAVAVVLLGLGAALLLAPHPPGEPEPVRVRFAGTRDDADAIVLRSGTHTLVIDTGEEGDGPHLLELLEEEGVDRIDCLILTHPDKDHIGGAPALLDGCTPDQVLVPFYEGASAGYVALLAQARDQGAQVRVLTGPASFSCGELNVRVWPPRERHYKKDNNYSLVTQVRHGQVSMLFAGDAQNKRLRELKDCSLDQADLYKVSHHGRDGEESAALIRRVQPAIAVVTARAPGPAIGQALEETGARVYCAVGRDLCFVSDGTELTLEEERPLPPD